MTRVARLVPFLTLFLALNLWAQHQGQGGGQHGPAKPDPSAASIRDFKIALAIQADPDQTAQYQSLAKNMDATVKQAHALQQAPPDGEVSKHASSFRDMVEQASKDNHDFMGSLSHAQKTVLKQMLKKLEKADSDLGKESKSFAQEVDGGKIDASQLQNAAGKLEKILTDVQAQQKSMADEMGIQSPTS